MVNPIDYKGFLKDIGANMWIYPVYNPRNFSAGSVKTVPDEYENFIIGAIEPEKIRKEIKAKLIAIQFDTTPSRMYLDLENRKVGPLNRKEKRDLSKSGEEDNMKDIANRYGLGWKTFNF